MTPFLRGFLRGLGTAWTFAAPVCAVYYFYLENYRIMMLMVIMSFLGIIIWHRAEHS